jgi:probable F420-dependent oxidoreductase
VKFGVIAPYAFSPIESPQYAAGFARLAEACGFESLWTVDHVVMAAEYRSVYPYDPSGRSPFHAHVAQPDALVWLAYVAAATARIRLATGVLILPQRNPLVLAKQAATLDRLSGGRLELGIGVGWVKEEADAVGVRFDDRGVRADEYIEAMRALWNQDEATYIGRTVRFERVVSEPRPLQAGGVPIIVGGHSKAAARRAGRYGNGFYPLGVDEKRLAQLLDVMRGEADANGRHPGGIELTLLGTPTLASAEQARKLGAGRMVIAALDGDLGRLGSMLETFRKDVIERM